MESITRNVRDLGQSERSAAERLVGHGLGENEQLIIQIVSIESPAPLPANGDEGEGLPAWCNVYDGLSDERIAEIERSIVRSRTNRMFD